MSKELSALIVDNQNDTELFTLLAKSLEIPFVTLHDNASDALRFMQKAEFVDLVIINFEILKDETFSLMKTLHETGKFEKTKFVLMAKSANKAFLMQASKVGFSLFIHTPFSKETVLNKLEKLFPDLNKRHKQRVNLLESVEAKLRFKQKETTGVVKNISDDGCLIQTPYKGRIGLEIYDVATIHIQFDDEKFGINGEVVRLEKDFDENQKAISCAFRIKNPDNENALKLAKFWAYILKERET